MHITRPGCALFRYALFVRLPGAILFTDRNFQFFLCYVNHNCEQLTSVIVPGLTAFAKLLFVQMGHPAFQLKVLFSLAVK